MNGREHLTLIRPRRASSLGSARVRAAGAGPGFPAACAELVRAPSAHAGQGRGRMDEGDRRYDLTGALGAAVARLRGVSPAWISDAQGTMNVMAPEINPVWDGAEVVGPAFTVRCLANSILTVHKALVEAPAGSVLVVDAAGDPSGALFGEMMATQARASGLAGLVTDGAVRDRDALRTLRFPVFARAVTPRVGANRRVGATQEDIACGGVVVRPGDLIVGGADGVAVIPRARLADVLTAVDAVAKKEAEMRARLERGETLADILNLRPLIDPA